MNMKAVLITSLVISAFAVMMFWDDVTRLSDRKQVTSESLSVSTVERAELVIDNVIVEERKSEFVEERKILVIFDVLVPGGEENLFGYITNFGGTLGDRGSRMVGDVVDGRATFSHVQHDMYDLTLATSYTEGTGTSTAFLCLGGNSTCLQAGGIEYTFIDKSDSFF